MKLEFDLISKPVLILGVVLITIIGCGTEPEFDRDNENDPNSELFTPTSINNLNYSIGEDKSIILNWNITSTYIDSIQIFKSILDSANFELLEVIPGNVSSFTDNSKQLSSITRYKLVSLSNSNTSTPVVLEINFIDDLTVNTTIDKNIVKLNWQTDTKLYDGLIITRRPNIEDEKIIIAELLPNISNFEFQIPNDGLTQWIGFEYIYNLKDQVEYVFTKEISIETGIPQNFEMTLTSESTVLLEWEDWIDFEDAYVLQIQSEQINQTVTLNPNTTNYEIIGDFLINEELKVSLSSQYSGLGSSPAVAAKTLNLPSPRLKRLENITGTSVRIIVEDTIRTQRNIQVFRNIKGEAPSQIGTIDYGDSVFVDIQLFQSRQYEYSFKSILSNISEPLNFIYESGLDRNEDLFINSNLVLDKESIAYSISTNQIAITKQSFPYSISVFSIEQNSLNKEITLDFIPSSLRFNSEGDKIVTISEVQKLLKIFDVNSGVLLQQVSLDYEEIQDFFFVASGSIVVVAKKSGSSKSAVFLVNPYTEEESLIYSPDIDQNLIRCFYRETSNTFIIIFQDDRDTFHRSVSINNGTVSSSITKSYRTTIGTPFYYNFNYQYSLNTDNEDDFDFLWYEIDEGIGYGIDDFSFTNTLNKFQSSYIFTHLLYIADNGQSRLGSTKLINNSNLLIDNDFIGDGYVPIVNYYSNSMNQLITVWEHPDSDTMNLIRTYNLNKEWRPFEF